MGRFIRLLHLMSIALFFGFTRTRSNERRRYFSERQIKRNRGLVSIGSNDRHETVEALAARRSGGNHGIVKACDQSACALGSVVVFTYGGRGCALFSIDNLARPVGC